MFKNVFTVIIDNTSDPETGQMYLTSAANIPLPHPPDTSVAITLNAMFVYIRVHTHTHREPGIHSNSYTHITVHTSDSKIIAHTHSGLYMFVCTHYQMYVKIRQDKLPLFTGSVPPSLRSTPSPPCYLSIKFWSKLLSLVNKGK